MICTLSFYTNIYTPIIHIPVPILTLTLSNNIHTYKTIDIIIISYCINSSLLYFFVPILLIFVYGYNIHIICIITTKCQQIKY